MHLESPYRRRRLVGKSAGGKDSGENGDDVSQHGVLLGMMKTAREPDAIRTGLVRGALTDGAVAAGHALRSVPD
jgi:hypothetical protein